jgi:DNA polymerase III subunit epsilon
MIGIFYDTETTGLPLFHEPSEDPRQPHLVQLAALQVDLDTREILASLDLIVRPDGWDIPADVVAVHGITTEHALDVGVPERGVLEAFMHLYTDAPKHHTVKRIAHNEPFDARIIRIGLKRYAGILDPDVWKAAPAECTQRLATPSLKLPPSARMRSAGRHYYKSPNLSEAYEHFTGQHLAGAHNATVDVKACMAVYFAIKDSQNPQAISALQDSAPLSGKSAAVQELSKEFTKTVQSIESGVADNSPSAGLGIIR